MIGDGKNVRRCSSAMERREPRDNVLEINNSRVTRCIVVFLTVRCFSMQIAIPNLEKTDSNSVTESES